MAGNMIGSEETFTMVLLPGGTIRHLWVGISVCSILDRATRALYSLRYYNMVNLFYFVYIDFTIIVIQGIPNYFFLSVSTVTRNHYAKGEEA